MTCVAPFGPPSVIICTCGNSWKTLISAIITQKNRDGVSSGRVIEKNCLIFPAPSTLEACLLDHFEHPLPRLLGYFFLPAQLLFIFS